MKIISIFLFGIFAAGILGGSWWLIVSSGVLLLLLRRSYFVLIAGVILDLVFTTGVGSPFYGGFYTILFITVTLVTEQFRSRLIWT